LSILVTRRPPLTKVMYFNGVNNQVIIPDSPSLRVNELTIEIMSFRATANPTRFEYLIFKVSDVWFGSISITDEADARTAFRIEAPQGVENRYYTAGPFWTVGQWVHGTFARKSNQAWIYKNGAQVAYTSTWSTNDIYYTTGSWYIPYYLGGIKRYVAFVRIYNRALSASEISHNYRNPNNPIRSGLVLWLDARNVSGSTWYDLSGNGNNGTISGATQVSIPNPPGGW